MKNRQCVLINNFLQKKKGNYDAQTHPKHILSRHNARGRSLVQKPFPARCAEPLYLRFAIECTNFIQFPPPSNVTAETIYKALKA